MKKRLTLCGLLGVLIFAKCKSHTVVAVTDPYVQSLVKKQVGHTSFYIFLPGNYSIKGNRMEDFDVYYFKPTDTTDKKRFSGGFYLGNAGSLFATDEADSCKMKEVEGEFLGEKVKWEYNSCRTRIFIQKLMNIKGAAHWPREVHAFGSAADSIEAKKMMLVFSTLHQESK